MKNISLTIAAFLITTLSATAQSNKVYVINPGEKITWVIPFNEIYEYPAFKQGIVFFRNKTTGGGNMNYSHLSQEMFFIQNNGDTLAIAEPKEVDSVLIGKDVFYNHADGFIKLDTSTADARLGESNFFTIVNKQVVGAYGQATNASGNSIHNRFTSDFAASGMVAQNITSLSKSRVLYISKRPNIFLQASKKNVSNVYGKKQNAFNQYILLNDVNFSNRNDIVKLMAWMSEQL
jgi:hypothetical protein